MSKLRFNKWGLIDDPIGGHCKASTKVCSCGREPHVLDVKAVYFDDVRHVTMLTVYHFNGEPHPQLAASAVTMLDRE